jgi:hypothetical protein
MITNGRLQSAFPRLWAGKLALWAGRKGCPLDGDANLIEGGILWLIRNLRLSHKTLRACLRLVAQSILTAPPAHVCCPRESEVQLVYSCDYN